MARCPECSSVKVVKLNERLFRGEVYGCLKCGFRWSPEALRPKPPNTDESPDEDGSANR